LTSVYDVDSLTLWKWNGDDEWGEPIEPTELSVKGYVDYKTRLVRNIAGEQVASEVTIYFMDKNNIDTVLGRILDHEDKIQLTGEDFKRPIISIGQPKAFSNPHYEVALT